MRKGLLLLCFAMVCAKVSAQDLSPQQINEQSSAATVLIRTDAGAGSGFFVSPDGLIATAFHVVSDAKRVGVKTAQGDLYDQVLLVAVDERRDLAILKIAGFDLPFVELGNSNEVQVGGHVVIIGNPLGTEKLQATVTDGIVSGLRDFGWGYNVIQVSAPISPGNSGGPVFSARGKVVGVAAFRLVGGESLNFAVPSNYLSGLLSIVSKEHPVRAWGGSAADSVFSSTAAGSRSMTGGWKSTCGAIYKIEDRGTNLRVLNLQNLAATYDLKWEADVVFGMVTNSGTSSEWFIIKPAQGERAEMWRFRAGRNDNRNEKLIQFRAYSAETKPDCVWVKVAD